MSDVDRPPDSIGSGATIAAPPGEVRPADTMGMMAVGGVPHHAPASLFAGRYELLRELGRGGMGVVHQARDTMVGDMVALKTLEITASEASVERFRREVRLARKITHPNVARTHDLGDAEGRHYLTMEFVSGLDLAKLIKRSGRLTPVRAASIAWMIGEGLAAAHGAGVIHRDLKPANILVERSGRVVVTDFGIARAFTQDTAAHTVGTVGTLVYMAPEQVTSESTDPRTDIYALGLLLYEMLTGELAFRGDTPLASAIARLSEPPPDPRVLFPEIPEPLSELVLHCLERDPERRPASASTLAGSLIDWLGSVGQTPEKCASMLQTSLASTTATGELMRSVTRSTSTTSRRSTGSPVSTLTRRTPADTMGRVAVLPLRFRGRSEHDYLGEALGEAVVDLLGRTHGVEVASASSTARFAESRDPAAIGEALNVAYVIDGTIQAAGANARVNVRLIEVGGGTQLWSHRFDGSLEDPFEFQDLLAQQIGEELRVELLYASYREHAGEEVLELCRQSRRLLGSPRGIYSAGLLNFEQMQEKYPTFTPLVPVLALMTLRGWFIGARLGGDIPWEDKVQATVSLARRQASDFPETRFALATLAVQEGRLRDAVVELRACLAGAPAYPAALQYLGNLQCEAGRADEGLRLIRTALALQPEQPAGFFEYARCSALRGDMETYAWALEELRKHVVIGGPVSLLELRVAAWYGDRETLERVLGELQGEPDFISNASIGYAKAALGLEPPSEEFIQEILSGRINPRFASMICQFATEEYCLVGQPEIALEYFNRASDSVLIDLEWTERCPILEPMRQLPGFRDGRRKVKERVESLWGS